MTTTTELKAMIDALEAELAQDDTDARIETKGDEARARRRGRTENINRMKADIRAAAARL